MFQSSQGNFIAGKIPKDIQFEVKDVWNEFLEIIPKDKKNDMAYHISYMVSEYAIIFTKKNRKCGKPFILEKTF